ncbi:MAG: universal stress protein [Thiotrichaceae bacterium]|nr:universal stress protein [Thiotrichaceae bacterium]
MSAYKQIVIAVDLSDDSQKVCRRALEITKGNKVNILLVHVVEYIYQMGISYDPMFYPSMEDLSENEEQLIKSAKEKMAALIKEVPAPETVDLVSSVISGIPKTEILRLAEEKQADLIVCGSHGRSGFELLLGSTANAILHHAPCDVLAVRTKKVKE